MERRVDVIDSGYWAWRVERAVPFARVAMYGSALGWTAFALGSIAVGSYASPRTILTTVFLILPITFAVLVVARSTRARRWLFVAEAIQNIVAGLAAIWILYASSRQIGDDWTDAATALVVIFVYYGCTIMRLPPAHAVVAITPYVALQQVLTLQAFTDDRARTIGYTLILWTAVVSGLLLSWALERVTRDAYRQERIIAEQHRIITRERERSETLLRAILPEAIAEQLKTTPGTVAEAHDDVSVVFADLVEFTPIVAQLAPTDLVALLNDVFSEFDRLVADRGLEKIKTIGDAFMAVAGLPSPMPDHVEACADLALAMRRTIRTLGQRHGRPLELRIGLHSGPVVAGVIGTQKFAYDLWGDTVNVAARMESHGLPGEIQVTEHAARLLADRGYRLRERGMVDIKGKGPMSTWILESGPARAAEPVARPGGKDSRRPASRAAP